MVGLRLTPPSARAWPGEGDECVGGGLLPVEAAAVVLVERALGLGDAPDGLLEDDALLERQPPAEAELAPPARPGHAQRAPLVERLVILQRGRGDRARRQRDLAGCLADRDTREFGVGVGGGVLGGGCDLIEAQRAAAERLIECRQAAQRAAGARDLLGAAVVAARELRQPLRTRATARRLPVTLVIGLAHDLGDALLDARLLLAERTQLTPPRLAPTLPRLIDRPIQTSEHTFASYQHRALETVPRLCQCRRVGYGQRVRLYHRHGSRSERVLWMLGELGAPHELVIVTQAEQASAAHRRRHPLARVPVLDDGDGPVFASAALCLHLADLHADAA